MLDPVWRASIDRILHMDIQERYPSMKKRQRDFIVRRVKKFCESHPEMIYGTTILAGHYNSGQYLKAWSFRYKKNKRMSVIYCVG